MSSKNSTTRNAAAAQARAEAQAKIRAQERRSMVLIGVGVVVAIGLFAAIVMFIMNQSELPELGEENGAVPAASTADGGIPVGVGGAVGVDVPDDALEVAVYADYLCGFCAMFEDINADDLDALREDGTIRLAYHPVAILDRNSPTQYSTRAVNAVATVANGSPEHFLAYSHLLFENQPGQGVEHPTDQQLIDWAVEVGVPQDVADSITDGTFRRWSVVASEQASVDGLRGTPTVMVEGEILDIEELPYLEPGVLRAYLEERANA